VLRGGKGGKSHEEKDLGMANKKRKRWELEMRAVGVDIWVVGWPAGGIVSVAS